VAIREASKLLKSSQEEKNKRTRYLQIENPPPFPVFVDRT
jgi:hypothetical protein